MLDGSNYSDEPALCQSPVARLGREESNGTKMRMPATGFQPLCRRHNDTTIRPCSPSTFNTLAMNWQFAGRMDWNSLFPCEPFATIVRVLDARVKLTCLETYTRTLKPVAPTVHMSWCVLRG